MKQKPKVSVRDKKLNYINLVSLRCGRFDKRICVKDKTKSEVDKIISNLKYDMKKFILIKT